MATPGSEPRLSRLTNGLLTRTQATGSEGCYSQCFPIIRKPCDLLRLVRALPAEPNSVNTPSLLDKLMDTRPSSQMTIPNPPNMCPSQVSQPMSTCIPSFSTPRFNPSLSSTPSKKPRNAMLAHHFPPSLTSFKGKHRAMESCKMETKQNV